MSAVRIWRERCNLALEARGPLLWSDNWRHGIALALLSAEKTEDENTALELVSATLRDECLSSYHFYRAGLADARRWLRESMSTSLVPAKGRVVE